MTDRTVPSRLMALAREEVARTHEPTMAGKPDRWWEAHAFRCANDHVSTMLLKSEELGESVCLACRGRVWLTFPEDRDGPLP